MANAALGPDSPSCSISLFREASIRSEATIGKSITSAAERAESATLSPLHFIFMMRKRDPVMPNPNSFVRYIG